MIPPRWKKVIRDVWLNRPRTLLVGLSIAVGVAAFGGVFIARAVLLREWRQGYTATHPAQIIVHGTQYDDDLVRAVAALRGVQAVEGQSAHYLQVSGPDGASYSLTLSVPSDLSDMSVDQVILEDGQWPGQRELALERMSAGLLGVRPGDRLTVDLPDGRSLDLPLAGTVHDYLASPATDVSPFLAGYVTPATLRQLGHPGYYDELHIVTVDAAASDEALDAMAEVIRDRIEGSGYPVSSVTTQQLTDHWAAQIIDGLTAIMAGIGLFSLGLSAFLVINTISAILAQQVRQIGMMKAIGARGWDVAGIYLALAAIFGALGLLGAVPMGIGLAYGVIGVLNDSLLNLDVAGFQLPGWVLGLQLASALGVPLLAALSPVVKGSRATAHAALNDYGVMEGFTARERESRPLSDRLPRPLLLTARNLFRRRGRTVLTLATLTLAGTVFMSVMNVRSGFMGELSALFRMFGHDIQLIFDEPYYIRPLEQTAARAPNVTAVEGWISANVRRIHVDGSEGDSFTLMGQPIPSAFTDPVMLEGRWLLPDDQNALVIGSEVWRKEPDLHVGDTIVLEIGQQETRWEVVGIVQMYAMTWGYANVDYLARLTDMTGQGQVLFVGTETHDGDAQQQVADDLKNRLQRAGAGVGSVMTRQTLIGVYEGVVNFVMYFLLLMAALLAVVGGLGLTGTMSVNIIERTREIGLMRAVGASSRAIRQIVVGEALLLGVMSWLLAAAVSVPFSALFSRVAGLALMGRELPPTYELTGYILWLAIVEVIAALSSLLPARQASRISVRAALAYE